MTDPATWRDPLGILVCVHCGLIRGKADAYKYQCKCCEKPLTAHGEAA